jgi:DNA-binding LacI/PurR family transcriptional regulator
MTMHGRTKEGLRKIKERIACGEMPFNSPFPSERKLCDEFEIGRGAVRAIMRELAECGMIRIEPGHGSRICWSPNCKLRRILVLEPSAHSLHDSAESLRILSGISATAASMKIEIALAFADSNSLTENLLERYSAGEYQGMIISEIFNAVELDTLLRRGIPAVVANSELSDKITCTRLDFRSVGRTAGRELIANGHRRIGLLNGNPELLIYKDMAAGLKGAMAEDDVTLNPDNMLVFTEANISETKRKLLKLLKSPARPQAFFASRDWRAAKLYECCHEAGLQLPEDISVISYDNLSWPDAAEYGLSTISEPAAELGAKALEMLRAWVENGARPESVILHGKLIHRNSIGKL